MSDKDLFVIGCGGQAKVIADVALRMGFDIKAFVDLHPREPEFFGRPVWSEAQLFRDAKAPVLAVAVGENWIRAQAAGRLIEGLTGARFPALIDPSAQISASATIADGTVIMPRAIVNASANIGGFAIVNSGAIVEHDTSVASFASIGPGATVCGGCAIGTYAHVGAGATLIHGIEVGAHALIGAGAAVVGPVASHAVMMGVPARHVKTRREDDRIL